MTTGPNCWQNTRSILRHGPIAAGTGAARAERRASQRTRRDHWADRVMKGIEDTELRHSGAITQRTPANSRTRKMLGDVISLRLMRPGRKQ
jgi:hypothetical protein